MNPMVRMESSNIEMPKSEIHSSVESIDTEKLDAKIEQQKETLEKAKARYEAEKDALAGLTRREIQYGIPIAMLNQAIETALIPSIKSGQKYFQNTISKEFRSTTASRIFLKLPREQLK